MLRSPLPEPLQAKNYSEEDIIGLIFGTNLMIESQIEEGEPVWVDERGGQWPLDRTRTLISRLYGLRICLNLKRGKPFNHDFKK